jgi:hypothetical protein
MKCGVFGGSEQLSGGGHEVGQCLVRVAEAVQGRPPVGTPHPPGEPGRNDDREDEPGVPESLDQPRCPGQRDSLCRWREARRVLPVETDVIHAEAGQAVEIECPLAQVKTDGHAIVEPGPADLVEERRRKLKAVASFLASVSESRRRIVVTTWPHNTSAADSLHPVAAPNSARIRATSASVK